MTENRIVFPGSPWPGGHRVSSLVWSARLLPGPELWFDLHLRSADYETTPEDDEEDESAWSSPGDAVRALGQVLAEADDYASPGGDNRRLSCRPR